MSHIYIQEPRADGKVILETSVGEIELEFWPKECPKATRNFIQLCLEGYYDGTIFHRIVKDFIAVGGDPTGTGLGGDSIYGKPFRDEFHSRLRFNRRGLLAMANLAKDDNNSQFFLTLGPASELQNKHTLFGRVIGDSIYNMIQLAECPVDMNEKPLRPPKIIRAIVVENPFPDIVPRVNATAPETKYTKIDKCEKQDKKVVDPPKTANDSNLLSFGEEMDDERFEGDDIIFKIYSGSKSSHSKSKKLKSTRESDQTSEKDGEATIKEEPGSTSKNDNSRSPSPKVDRRKRIDEMHEKLEKLKQEIGAQELVKIKKERFDTNKETDNTSARKIAADLFVAETKEIYKKATNIPKKGSKEREQQTLAMMERFKNKLSSNHTTKRKPDECESDDNEWLNHEFNVENNLILAKDANLKTADWYSIDDPRNPINKRRHEKPSHSSHRSSGHHHKHHKRDH